MIWNLLYAGLVVVVCGVLWYGLPLAHRWWQCWTIRHKCAQSRSIVLTYDDGPGECLTPALLSLLEQYNAKATFFALGFRARAKPDVLNQIIGAGHEVGVHSTNHLNAWKSLPWKATGDLLSDSWFATITGKTPDIVRPPYGKMILPTWIGSIIRSRHIVWWTADSGDTWATLPDIHERAKAIVENGGGVVLLHDFDRDEHADSEERKAFVLTFTEEILRLGGDAGYRFCRYSDLRAAVESNPSSRSKAGYHRKPREGTT